MGYMKLGTVENAEEAARSRLADINRLGEIIVRHGYGELVGISLLHRHYDIEPGEVLLTNECEGVLLSSPSALSEVGKIERCWFLDTEIGDWVPYEFIAEAIMENELSEIAKLRSDCSFWQQLGRAMDELEVAGLFGLTLLDPRSKSLPSDITLLEVNAADARRSIVFQIPSDSIDSIEAGVTVWNFFEISGEKRPSVGCAYGNTQHCCGNIAKVRALLTSLSAPTHLLIPNTSVSGNKLQTKNAILAKNK